MTSILKYSLVFILGLAFGYWVNIFFTNKPYHDLVRENKALKAQFEESTKSEGLDAATCAPPGAATAPGTSDTLPEGHGDQAVAVAPGDQASSASSARTSPGLGVSTGSSAQPGPVATQGAGQTLAASEVETQEDLDRFLKESQRENAFDLLKQNRPLNESTAQRLSGLYSGEILFTRPKTPDDKRWEIEMVIEGEWERGQFRGRDEINLFRGTKNFSSSRSGQGSTLKRYTMGADGSLWISLLGKGEYQMQLFYLPKLDRWTGHIYEQQSLDQYTHRGHVSMFRR
ncbi:MAG: hypothetical protein ACK5Y2_13350 [Bdellovibrionales bacterium]